MRDVSLPPKDEVAEIIKEAVIRRPLEAVALAEMVEKEMLEFRDNWALQRLAVELRLNSPEAAELRPIFTGLRSSVVEWTEPDDPEIRHHGIKFELRLPEIKPVRVVLKEVLGLNPAENLMDCWTGNSVDFSKDAPLENRGNLVLGSQNPNREHQKRALQRAGCEGFMDVVSGILLGAVVTAKAQIAGVPLCWRAGEWDRPLFISAGAVNNEEFTLLEALRESGIRLRTGTLGIDELNGTLGRYDYFTGEDCNPETLAFGAPVYS